MFFGEQSRLRALLDHFSVIEDPREPWKVAHPLPEVLLLVVCGMIADCDDYDHIAAWGEAHLPFLREMLPYHHGAFLAVAGFIRDWHGLPQVVDAMAAMENREQLHFLVVGDGPGRAELEEHARQIGMAAQVTCLGLVGRDGIAACVSAFDIALQPKVCLMPRL
jgi:glycosyltransferase involved in cell wall biosynthesis